MSDRRDFHSEESYLIPDFHEHFGIALNFSESFSGNWNVMQLMNEDNWIFIVVLGNIYFKTKFSSIFLFIS